jgi:hypothetical protein
MPTLEALIPAKRSAKASRDPARLRRYIRRNPIGARKLGPSIRKLLNTESYAGHIGIRFNLCDVHIELDQ